MSFENMLSQMPNLQQKFFICPMHEEEGGSLLDTTQAEKDAWVGKKQKQLDKAMEQTKIPTILLERLKREFDEVEALN